ncbi:MAG TPA: vWA domain-containing protein [Spirochaetales bacterium]|nr:vWA domain-containing protein [Spirochaetales bacterium]
MKQTGIIATVLCLAATLAVAQPVPVSAQDRVDLVVLLDSSRSMFPYYEQVVDYVLSGALKDYMRSGDAFHLISFSDSTQVELSQVLRTEEDLRAVLARLYLLYPLGENTDLVNALRNTLQYVSDLPDSGRKHIILVTDGMHSPSTASPWAALDQDGVRKELENAAGRIRERGWTMSIVRVPFDASAASASGGPGAEAAGALGSGNYLDDVAQAAGVNPSTFDPLHAASALDSTIALPRIVFPSALGKRDYAFVLPFTVENRSDGELRMELTGLFLQDGTNILQKRVFLTVGSGATDSSKARVLLPEGMSEGQQTVSVEPRFADGMRVAPARSEFSITLKKSFVASFFRNTVRAIVFLALVVLLLVLLILLVRYVRTVHSRSEAPVVNAVLDSQELPYRADSRNAAALLGSVQGAAQNRVLDSARTALVADSAKPAALAYRPDTRDAAAILASAQPGRSARPASAANAARPESYAATQRDGLSVAASDNRNAALLLQNAQTAQNAQKLAAPADTRAGVSAMESDQRSALLSAWKTSQKPQERLGTVGSLSARPVAVRETQQAFVYTGGLKRPGAARFELTVSGQNANIGTRNIKAMHAGGKRSIGGGKSDFSVFLLPVPRRIADVYYDGENVTVVPLRRAYFPYAEGPLENCLDTDLPIMLPGGKTLCMRIQRYRPPVEQINKLLHCIDSPGVDRQEAQA